MFLLILGVLLWAGSHSIRHLAPAFREGLGEAQAKGFVSAASLVAIGLMIIGYRSAEPRVLYDLGTDAVYLNNILMVVGIALVMAQTTKSRLRNLMRHPMLTGFILWAIAHLAVAGEWRAIVLFGGLAAWALTSMVMINRAEPNWTPPGGTARGDAILVTLTVVVGGVAAAIHIWLGLQPFGAM